MFVLNNALAILLLSTTIRAQNSIIPSNEPHCVNQCPVFQQALAACEPDQGDQAQYVSCFCQSAYLIQLRSSNANICSPQCTDSDFGQIVVWYNGFCANGGTVPSTTSAPPGTTMVIVTTTPPAGGASSSSSAQPAPTQLNQGSGIDDDAAANSWTDGAGWFHTHWQWVVMIIVLAVAFTAIGVGGNIWYRRYKNRREYGDSTAPRTGQASHPEISQWAPSQQSIHDFGTGPMPTNMRQNMTDSPGGSPVSRNGNAGDVGPTNDQGGGIWKGKGKDVTAVERARSPALAAGPSRAPSRRLTKTPVGGNR